ncbi:MAG TPA: branched-chain amino acid transport system II carrier protein [Patescibacteria group bacterium]|jgi:LIVCS family branched-chain amino acid:cation transporter|nr:branched-chain amino acid transport system II carrier protein [Patescibacteria group bacterium]
MSKHLLTTGLAIFSMFFGAGNLIYPLVTGITAGQYTWIGMIGFLLTAAFLPLLGLISMIFFDGDYDSFFGRLGNIPGKIAVFLSMMIIGPVIAIPRIVTLSEIMIQPFIPWFTEQNPYQSLLFALIFLAITFLATYQENKIMAVLGNIISPILLGCLGVIVTKGLYEGIQYKEIIAASTTNKLTIFTENFIRGYETLDLLGAIFFASIIISLLKMQSKGTTTAKQLSETGLEAGLIGVTLLCFVYIGMSTLSIYHGHGLEMLDAGQLFREIALRILGSHGTLIIALAVLLACLSTAIALAAIVAAYIEHEVMCHTVTYIQSLIITLIACLPLSIFGLEKVLMLTGGPIVYIGYPLLITLTLCNLGYKTIGFTYVKVPVLLTGIIATILYVY